jgi:hypothetical protein
MENVKKKLKNGQGKTAVLVQFFLRRNAVFGLVYCH